jgi:hypothetical protein
MQRLVHHRIATAACATAAEAVAHLGAMQGQDYAGVKWSIGARMANATDREVEAAFDRGEVLRTWPMRGTLHVVAPADIRWILDLLRPRILGKNQGRYRELELDDAVMGQATALVARALEGRAMTRDELASALREGGIDPTGQRMAYMLQRAGIEKVICFGPRRGKEFTYVLLDEFSPSSEKPWDREEALRELTLRYFRSRGPAAPADFAMWAGLPLSDAKAGLRSAGDLLVEREGDWGPPSASGASGVFAIPGFDEFFIGYQNRDAILDPSLATRVVPGGNGVFHPIIVVDGQVVGTWRRTIKAKRVEISVSPFGELDQAAFERAAGRYAAFLELDPVFV